MRQCLVLDNTQSMGVLTKQEQRRENTTLVDDRLSKVGCVMSVMTHLDFCRVLSHHHCADTEHPPRLGVSLNTIPSRLSSAKATACLREISGDTTVFCYRQRPINGRFSVP